MLNKELHIESTKNTPLVEGNMDEGFLSFKGNTFPENSKKFYDPILFWITESKNYTPTIEISASFNYISSSSLIAILNLLKKTQAIFGDKYVTLKWYYENDDEDVLKIAEDYKKVLNLSIITIPIEPQ